MDLAGQRAGSRRSPAPSPTTSPPAWTPRACGSSAARGRLDGPPGWSPDRRRGRRRSRPTRCWWPPVRTPGCCPTPQPDGERILTWEQVYALEALPEHLVVVGSGVTGAEFASAYTSLGTEVTLVVQPRPGAARRGRGRGHGARGRLPPPRHDRACRSPAPSAVRRDGRRRGGHARRRPHGRGQPLPDGGRLDPQHGGPRSRGGRRPARRTAGSSRWTGSPGRRRRACTPPATAPASSCWRRSRRCRAGSRCGTRSATP